MPSVEPSSITRIARFFASTPSSRSTLSAIVTSSFRAGTRNTQSSSSVEPASGGAFRSARRDAMKSASVQTQTMMMITKTTTNSD